MTRPSRWPDALIVLEDRGFRLTGPRRQVAASVQRMKAGFTAESLCEANAGVGRATVYRTLRLLLDAGVICRLPMPDGAPRYQRALVEHHHHIVCTRCGSVGEFRDSTVERLVRSVGKELDGQIVGHRMEFYVVCRTCLENGGAGAAPPPAARAAPARAGQPP